MVNGSRQAVDSAYIKSNASMKSLKERVTSLRYNPDSLRKDSSSGFSFDKNTGKFF
jgi:hypothetical protein